MLCVCTAGAGSAGDCAESCSVLQLYTTSRQLYSNFSGWPRHFTEQLHHFMVVEGCWLKAGSTYIPSCLWCSSHVRPEVTIQQFIWCWSTADYEFHESFTATSGEVLWGWLWECVCSRTSNDELCATCSSHHRHHQPLFTTLLRHVFLTHHLIFTIIIIILLPYLLLSIYYRWN